MVWHDRRFSFDWLSAEARRWIGELGPEIQRGVVVALSADYSPRGVAMLLALIARGGIAAPITSTLGRQRSELLEVAEANVEVLVDDEDSVSFQTVGHVARHPLLLDLQASGSGGLILFSSGSSGRSKAVVHHGERLLAKYRTPRRAAVTIPFMMFDHIGGVNTLLHTLSSGGTAVFPGDRQPSTICRLIEAHGVQVMPATPTFINLLLLSELSKYDLSSLEVLAYGAERMSEATLSRLAAAFPGVRLVQNYGLSEVGIMRTKSESSDSLWMSLGGDGFQTRVRDGLLEIKSDTAMLGYLNEASPFTEDGWLMTNDRVEVRGELIRILGRESDVIIIGGEKVYPAEVEDAITLMEGVVEVVVGAEPNAITGHIVTARVWVSTGVDRATFRQQLRAFLSARLAEYKIPQRVTLANGPLHNVRGKRVR